MLTVNSIITSFFDLLANHRENHVVSLNNIEHSVRNHGLRNLGPGVVARAASDRWAMDAFDYVLNEKGSTTSEEDFLLLMDSLTKDMVAYLDRRIGTQNRDHAYYETLTLIWEIGREKKAHFARVKSE